MRLYCKYCYATHTRWQQGGDFDDVVMICGECNHATKLLLCCGPGVIPKADRPLFELTSPIWCGPFGCYAYDKKKHRVTVTGATINA
jgi:hypothetical protein